MAGVQSTALGPPPVQTPITVAGDEFGVPFQARGSDSPPTGNLQTSWVQWFNRLYRRVLGSPKLLSSTQANLSALAGTLALADVGTLVNVTDFGHVLQWTGSAWQWGPGEQGSGMMVLFEADPTGAGWHLYDGTANVPYLKSDGTTLTVTLPDLVSTAAYLNAGNPNAGPNAATAPGITGSTAAAATGDTIPANTGTPSATTNFAQGTGATVTVASSTHTHTEGPVSTPTHVHAVGTLAVNATGEPRNLVRRPWFRQ